MHEKETAIMATKRSTKKQPDFPTRENGDPDVLTMIDDQEMSWDEIQEAADITRGEAHRLLWEQEVEDDPSLKINLTGAKLAARIVKERDENKVRWERLAIWTGMSKAALVEIYEDTTGNSAKRARSANGASAEVEEEAPAPKRGRRSGRKATEEVTETPPKRRGSRRAAAAPVEEAEEVEEETPAARPARRSSRRAARA
jgi:hypothetical protein